MRPPLVLDRSFSAHLIMSDAELCRFFLWCLWRAETADRVALVRGRKVDLRTGDFVFSRSMAAEELKISEKVVRRLVANLVEDGLLVEAKRASTFTVYSVVNFDGYIGTENEEGQQKAGKRPAKGQPRASQGPAENADNAEMVTVASPSRATTTVDAVVVPASPDPAPEFAGNEDLFDLFDLFGDAPADPAGGAFLAPLRVINAVDVLLPINKKTRNADEDIPYGEILGDLNQQAGKNFRTTDGHKKMVRARWREGFTFEDFRTVHRKQVIRWGNDETMSAYLRPETLYSSKFDAYLNAPEMTEVGTLGRHVAATLDGLQRMMDDVGCQADSQQLAWGM